MKRNTYVYEYKNAVYINLTNRCTNRCTFCIRNGQNGVGGHNLWLKKEPEADEVIRRLKKMKTITEVIFCGYGEPTIRLDTLKEVAAYVKRRGGRVRVNTNGHASAYHQRDTAKELKGLVDVVSISLNATSAAAYQKLCRSDYGEAAYDHMLRFAKDCVKNGIETIFTVVDFLDADEIKKSKQIADEIGAALRIRHYT